MKGTSTHDKSHQSEAERPDPAAVRSAGGLFLLQLTRIDQAPWENYDSWRQTDTYTIAQNYDDLNMNPLRPQFNYDGPGENYVQLELQIMPYLSALAFRLLGSQPYWVPRLISLLFFMGSALFVFGIGRRLFRGDLPALWAAGTSRR